MSLKKYKIGLEKYIYDTQLQWLPGKTARKIRFSDFCGYEKEKSWEGSDRKERNWEGLDRKKKSWEDLDRKEDAWVGLDAKEKLRRIELEKKGFDEIFD